MRVCACAAGLSALLVGSVGPMAAPAAAAKAPSGLPGELSLVAAVPHSSVVWVVGRETAPHSPWLVARWDKGHWQRVQAPKVGPYGMLTAIAAAPGGTLWLGGDVQEGAADNPNGVGVIWRWNGHKFLIQYKGDNYGALSDVQVASISASSATNAWAVMNYQGTYHWNGRKWSEVSPAMDEVSTSGPDSAFAIGSGDLWRWDGKAWSQDGTTPSDYQMNSIATSSATLAYAVGVNTSSYRPITMRFNGKAWSVLPVAQGRFGRLISVSTAGSSVWAVAYTGLPPSFVIHSTGKVWSTQTLGKHDTVNAVSAQSANHAYVVGYSGSPTRTLFAVYNGHSWTILPSDI